VLPRVRLVATPPAVRVTCTKLGIDRKERDERSTYFRPRQVEGVDALHASFVRRAYQPHSHPTWTTAVVEAGAARFSVEKTEKRADAGELFVLEPDAVHTGMAAVPAGWTYKVLYLEPDLLGQWTEGDARTPRASRWVVFRDKSLRARLLRAHGAFAAGESGMALGVPVVEAVAALRYAFNTDQDSRDCPSSCYLDSS
jgi:hypothetical protein